MLNSSGFGLAMQIYTAIFLDGRPYACSGAVIPAQTVPGLPMSMPSKTGSRQIHVSLEYGFKNNSEDPMWTSLKLCGYYGVDKARIRSPMHHGD
jgi:hypothetical protein